MRIIIRVEEDTFHSGKVSEEKTDPPVIEYIDKDGWGRRAKLSKLDKFPQFTGRDRTFLEEVNCITDILSSSGIQRE